MIEHHPALEQELLGVRDYYENCSKGLGLEFVEAFDRQVLLIAEMPERWMIVERDVRRCLMKRFPYVIYFRVIDDDILRITVVKHEKEASGLRTRERVKNPFRTKSYDS